MDGRIVGSCYVQGRVEVVACRPPSSAQETPSIPAEAPRPAFEAAASMLDRPALMVLTDAFPLATSTSRR